MEIHNPTCSICEESKEIGSFYSDKRKASGIKAACKECTKEQNKEYLIQKGRVKRRLFEEEYYKQEHVLQKRAKYRAKLENRLANVRYQKQYRTDNKDKVRYHRAKYRAKKLDATIGNFDKEIKEVYKNSPEGFHVDHIVPLQSKTVCGLHVPWNLQYLPAKENLRKGNKFYGIKTST